MITPIKIESTPAFVEFAKRRNIDHYEFAEKLATELFERLLVDTWCDGYGKTLGVWLEDAALEDVNEAIKSAGVDYVTISEFMAIMNTIVKGNGDCPECGDTMEFDHCWQHKGRNYDTYICPNCGYSYFEDAKGYD